MDRWLYNFESNPEASYTAATKVCPKIWKGRKNMMLNISFFDAFFIF